MLQSLKVFLWVQYGELMREVKPARAAPSSSQGFVLMSTCWMLLPLVHAASSGSLARNRSMHLSFPWCCRFSFTVVVVHPCKAELALVQNYLCNPVTEWALSSTWTLSRWVWVSVTHPLYMVSKFTVTCKPVMLMLRRQLLDVKCYSETLRS